MPEKKLEVLGNENEFFGLFGSLCVRLVCLASLASLASMISCNETAAASSWDASWNEAEGLECVDQVRLD